MDAIVKLWQNCLHGHLRDHSRITSPLKGGGGTHESIQKHAKEGSSKNVCMLM